jgi:hypothetical protein
MVITASAYAYTCALASEDDLAWIVELTGRGIRKWAIDELGKFRHSEGPQAVDPDYKAEFILKRGKEALRSVGKLLPRSKRLRARIKAEERVLARCVKSEGDLEAGKRLQKTSKSISSILGDRGKTVYRRPIPGPVDVGAVLMDTSSRWKTRYGRWLQKEKAAYVMQPLMLYWMDGRRTTEEICRLIAAETGHSNPEFVAFCLRLLEEAGIVEAVKG